LLPPFLAAFFLAGDFLLEELDDFFFAGIGYPPFRAACAAGVNSCE
jgi:hypothetical protein